MNGSININIQASQHKLNARNARRSRSKYYTLLIHVINQSEVVADDNMVPFITKALLEFHINIDI
jgi:hypothetical protein